MNKLNLEAALSDAGRRLDVFLSLAAEGISRAAAVRMIGDGSVLVNGAPVKKNYLIRGGELVEISLKAPAPASAEAEDIALNVLYEDADIIAVNKPRGMVVHPAAGHGAGTLVNALLFHCGESLSGIGGALRPGIVHRLDKDTTGVIVAAKNDYSHNALSARLKARDVLREYEAVVTGGLRDDDGVICATVGRHPSNRKKMATNVKNGREAITNYRALGRYAGYTHVLCSLVTGRTHQIRVHMASLGHPVAGDSVYGSVRGRADAPVLMLHARRVGFTHPVTGKALIIEASPPGDFAEFLEKIKRVSRN